MPITLVFVEPDGTVRSVAAPPVGSLMQAALAHGIVGIIAECGGTCSCGNCRVSVAQDGMSRLPEPAADELDMLSLSDIASDQSRLSCQIALTPGLDGLIVRIPEVQG
jgi:ferredoxin, 2Fe-2S